MVTDGSTENAPPGDDCVDDLQERVDLLERIIYLYHEHSTTVKRTFRINLCHWKCRHPYWPDQHEDVCEFNKIMSQSGISPFEVFDECEEVVMGIVKNRNKMAQAASVIDPPALFPEINTLNCVPLDGSMKDVVGIEQKPVTTENF